jgi:hypothetical protein
MVVVIATAAAVGVVGVAAPVPVFIGVVSGTAFASSAVAV